MMERNASGMFILYQKVLLEIQVDDTVKSRLSILMLILKDNFTKTIIFTNTKKIENTKPENIKEKSPNSPLYSASGGTVIMISINLRESCFCSEKAD